MAFKVRNLMIHILPDAQKNAQLQFGPAFANNCGWWTLPGTGPGCHSNPEALATLKAQLQSALADVEAQEKALNEQLAPQTIEEAKALEGHLVDALAEVRQRIEELQNRDGGG